MPEDSAHLQDRLDAATLELQKRLTDERRPRGLVVSRFGLDAVGGEREERWPSERIPGLASRAGSDTGFLELRRFDGGHVLAWEWECETQRPATAMESAVPLWLAARLGVGFSLVLAAGEPLRSDEPVPRIALVRDHIRLFTADPLQGWPSPREGARHPQLTDLYDPGLRAHAAAWQTAAGHGSLERVAVDRPGPSGVTPAEREALQRLGAEVLLQGGLAEAIAARHVGLRHAMIVLLLGQPEPVDPGVLAEQAELLMPSLTALVQSLIAHGGQEEPD